MGAKMNSTTEIIAKLVAFDTTPEKSNLPLLDWVEDYLSKSGMPTRQNPSLGAPIPIQPSGMSRCSLKLA